MAYSTVSQVKKVLAIEDVETTWDAEIADCITSADALIDSFLKREGLTVPSPTPQPIADASRFFAAWLYRRFTDPVGAEAFWSEANRFLEAYVEGEKEPYVGVA